MDREELEEDMEDAFGVDGDPLEGNAADNAHDLVDQLDKLAPTPDDDDPDEDPFDEDVEGEEEEEREPEREAKVIQNKGKVCVFSIPFFIILSLQRKFATRREYEVYHFQRRKHWKSRFAAGGKLAQLYIIQAVTQIYQQRTAIWRAKNSEFLNSTK